MSNEYKRWKAQQDKIEELTKENEELKKRIDSLVSLVEEYEQRLSRWV